jgi:hypothetical protein
LLFVLVDEMNEGFDQVVVDLAEPVIGEAQQIQASCWRRHALELINRVELDQRGVILYAFIGQAR